MINQFKIQQILHNKSPSFSCWKAFIVKPNRELNTLKQSNTAEGTNEYCLFEEGKVDVGLVLQPFNGNANQRSTV